MRIFKEFYLEVNRASYLQKIPAPEKKAKNVQLGKELEMGK